MTEEQAAELIEAVRNLAYQIETQTLMTYLQVQWKAPLVEVAKRLDQPDPMGETL